MEDLDCDDSPDVFTKDCDSTAGKKGLWDKRCMTVGVVVLALIVCGAIAAILMHRFTGKGPPVYDGNIWDVCLYIMWCVFFA